MQKTNIFSKFNIKSSKEKLEEILEVKNFSEGVKNILLNILYKIEVSYNDYSKVKRISKTKLEYLDYIVQIIQDKCDEIKLVKLNSEESKILEDKVFIINKEEKKIITYPSEKYMLYAVVAMNETQFTKEIIVKDPFKIVLTKGNGLEYIEMLTDFDGWSWNVR